MKKMWYNVKMINIMFLDFDGVISTPSQWKHRGKHIYPSGNHSYGLTQSCVDLLKEIINSTQCKVVISSTWRNLYSIEELEWLFRQYDLHINIYGITRGNEKGRGQEIIDWLNDHKDINNYVVIDDESFGITGTIPQSNFVQCSTRKGLTQKNKNRAIKILNTGDVNNDTSKNI